MSLLRRRAPRLVVRCPCGTSTGVAAGAVVECPCGRRWDTADVPDQDLDGVSRVLRRSRARRLVFIGNLLLVAAALVLLGRTSPALATLLAAFVWWRFCRPEWRRRRQAMRTSSLPTWRLHASGGGDKPSPGDVGSAAAAVAPAPRALPPGADLRAPADPPNPHREKTS